MQTDTKVRVDQSQDGQGRPVTILRFTGWEVLAPHIVYAPVRISDEQRQAAIQSWAARLRAIESESPIEVGEY